MDNNPRQDTEKPTRIEEQRQTSNLNPRWSWVEPEIWSDKMLTALENGVKGGKWFSLIDKIYSKKVLEKAWLKVKKNRGAAGVDNISVERFAKNQDKYLDELERELREGTYKPHSVKRVYIDKEPGKKRPLGIPTIKDRIAQQAAKMALEPILENEFLDMNYGFRPKRNAKDALREVDKLLKSGYTWVIDADLAAYFDTIPHDKLMVKVKKYVSDRKFLNLIEEWLKQKILEENREWKPTSGSPQGAVISPLLANLYLHDLDTLITNLGIKMVRFADDFVILTDTEEKAKAILTIVQKWSQENGLTIHPDKTHIGNYLIEGQGFDFLGYRFENGKIWIRKKSIMKFRDKIREETRRTCGKSLSMVINKLNPILRGWYNHFKHVYPWNLNTFDAFVRRRLRSILRRQNKKSKGTGRCLSDHLKWPNKYFADLGLFTMEKARRLESACRSRCGNFQLESRMR